MGEIARLVACDGLRAACTSSVFLSSLMVVVVVCCSNFLVGELHESYHACSTGGQGDCSMYVLSMTLVSSCNEGSVVHVVLGVQKREER